MTKLADKKLTFAMVVGGEKVASVHRARANRFSLLGGERPPHCEPLAKGCYRTYRQNFLSNSSIIITKSFNLSSL